MEKLPLGLALDLRKVVPYKTGSWRTQMPVHVMQTPPCTFSCPINNDIRGFLRILADKKNFGEAYNILTRTNPLPAICGRVCPHPCEEGCNRRDLDYPLAINCAKRAVGDYAIEKKLDHPKEHITPRKEKVAIIGSGPAGLSCAFHLAKWGFKVKIFEAEHQPGGMLRWGLPVHERLQGMKEIYSNFDPEEILKESDRCFSCGLCFQCNNCLMYCPDNAVNMVSGAGRYTFDLDFCKGCGICSKECPCHYIHMTLE